MSSSRLAEAWKKTTLSPAAIFVPLSSVSTMAVRRKFITGVTKRSISSTADGRRLRSSSNLCHCSGFWKKACMAPDMRLRVVSLPATVSRRKNSSSSMSLRRSPSISTVVSALMRSAWGSIRFLAKSSDA